MDRLSIECKVCRWGNTHTHTTFTLEELEKSASAGCKTCGYLVKASGMWPTLAQSQVLQFDQQEKKTGPHGPQTKAVLIRKRPNTVIQLAQAQKSSPAPPDEFQIELYRSIGGPHEENLIQLPNIPKYPSSNQTLDFIKKQFSECNAHHDVCRQQNLSVTSHPKRLLRLYGSKVFLIDTPRKFNDKYVALSYCWGKESDHADTVKTTRDKLTRMQHGVSISDLPPTLRDAIEVTRHLDMSLIWIDALCIIQKDVDDWVEESQKMAGIYSGAFLVIHAACCSSVKDSFLSHSRHSVSLDDEHNIHARRLNAFGHHGTQSYRVNDATDLRAWTLQEKALSVRSLRYSEMEVQWDCLGARTCECGQKPSSDANYFYSYTSLLSHFQKDLLDVWTVIVEDYSKRDMTYDTDVLTALSGLAQSLATQTGARYIAGLWIDFSSPMCLLWQATETLSPFPEDYIAPSFSWASLRRRAIFPNIRHDSSHVKILSAESEPYFSDAFGRIKSASLRLQGHLIPALLDLDGSSQDVRLQDDEEVHLIFEFDGLLEKSSTGKGRFTAQRARSREGGETRLKSVQVDFLPLVSKNSGDYFEMFGLILCRSSTFDGYERLGYARKWMREESFPWTEESTFSLF